MAYSTSSTLGVNLTAATTAPLFALNQKVLGTGDSEWHYVIATAALVTGQFVQINSAGTANILSTAILNGAGVDGTTGNLDRGVAQFAVAAGSYAFVAKKGQNMYIRCSGTCPPGARLTPNCVALWPPRHYRYGSELPFFALFGE